MRTIVCPGLLFTLFLVAVDSRAQASDVPKNLRPPDGQPLIAQFTGKGNQIYVCQITAGVYAWKLKALEAKLFDQQGSLAGRHFAGPTWEANDGSRVAGKLVTSVPSPDPSSLPWLLLAVKSHEGTGLVANVNSIQRLDTKDGVAPSESCGAPDKDKEVPVPYQATYSFYGPAPSSAAH